jgi:hypothetical protein
MSVEEAIARLKARDGCGWHYCSDCPHWVVWEVRAGIRVVQLVWENGCVVYKLFHHSLNLLSGSWEWHHMKSSHEFEEVLCAA